MKHQNKWQQTLECPFCQEIIHLEDEIPYDWFCIDCPHCNEEFEIIVDVRYKWRWEPYEGEVKDDNDERFFDPWDIDKHGENDGMYEDSDNFLFFDCYDCDWASYPDETCDNPRFDLDGTCGENCPYTNDIDDRR